MSKISFGSVGIRNIEFLIFCPKSLAAVFCFFFFFLFVFLFSSLNVSLQTFTNTLKEFTEMF